VTANDEQIGGRHYIEKAIQPWDFIVQNKMGYLEGCIIKYVSRYKEKGGLEDLIKAAHYLEKLIEVNTDDAERIPETPISTIASAREEVNQIWKE
jgi:hypothetical protein